MGPLAFPAAEEPSAGPSASTGDCRVIHDTWRARGPFGVTGCPLDGGLAVAHRARARPDFGRHAQARAPDQHPMWLPPAPGPWSRWAALSTSCQSTDARAVREVMPSLG
jgi:hypothetical protein